MRRPLASLLLLAIAVAGGPGQAGLEAYQHAHRRGPGHGHRTHFEARGGQDHDDACRAWRLTSPARTPVAPAVATRLPVFPEVGSGVAAPVLDDQGPNLLPLSRAPPRSV